MGGGEGRERSERQCQRDGNRGRVSKAEHTFVHTGRKSCRVAVESIPGLGLSRSKLVSDSLRGEVALIGDRPP